MGTSVGARRIIQEYPHSCFGVADDGTVDAFPDSTRHKEPIPTIEKFEVGKTFGESLLGRGSAVLQRRRDVKGPKFIYGLIHRSGHHEIQ